MAMDEKQITEGMSRLQDTLKTFTDHMTRIISLLDETNEVLWEINEKLDNL